MAHRTFQGQSFGGGIAGPPTLLQNIQPKYPEKIIRYKVLLKRKTNSDLFSALPTSIDWTPSGVLKITQYYCYSLQFSISQIDPV